MAEVTFPLEFGGDGQTYTDDADPDTGLDGTGYITRFVPCLAGAVAMGAFALDRAEAAQAFAATCQALRDQAQQAAASANQNAVATAADRQQTGQDRQATNADAQATAADRQQTGLDRETTNANAQATAADRQQTGQDRAATNANAQATAADREQTGQDRTATGENAQATAADRQQTGLDRQAVAEDLTAATASASAAGDYARMLQATYRGQRIGTEIIAHRGFRQASIQNTLLALTTCLDGGADSLEFDVQVTSDGVLVIYHDDALDSLTDGVGTVIETDSTTVLAAAYTQALGTAYEGTGIPKLAELVDYLQLTQARFYPEIKAYRTVDDIDAMVAMIQGARLSSLCCWQSFTPADLVRVRELDAACEVGFLVSDADLVTLEALADQASQYLPATLLVKHTTVAENPSIVSYARARGVDVGVWTIDTREQLEAMKRLGVTRLMCDQYFGREA